MNALPALQTFLYDGWILRFANGYTNRANSINPIYASHQNIDEKILRCETIYKDRNIKPTYKITPFVCPENLDELLHNRGYKVIHHTSVQMLRLINITEPSTKLTIEHSESKEKWFKSYCNLNKVSEPSSIFYERMLDQLIPDRFYSSIEVDYETIACGLAVIEKEYIGLFDIVVSEKYRNRGYGTQLLLAMLKAGKEQGARNAYLQVMLDNEAALYLYRKLGFKEQYQYHYRVLDNNEL